jgi:hypothetical protein
MLIGAHWRRYCISKIRQDQFLNITGATAVGFVSTSETRNPASPVAAPLWQRQ